VDAEEYVIGVLGSMGINAEKIPESDSDSPDFIASYGKTKLLVELKTKTDDLEKLKTREEILARGDIYNDSTEITHQKTIAKRIRKASKQLDATDLDVDFRIVWLLALGEKQDTKLKQFEMTLYGSVNLFDLSDGTNQMKSCFYFGESSFYRYRDILDGAMVSTLDKGRFCINNHSPNYAALKNSDVIGAFGEGILDPVELEKEGRAYIADSEVDRSNKADVLSSVQKKYKKSRLIDLNFTHYSATTTVSYE